MGIKRPVGRQSIVIHLGFDLSRDNWCVAFLLGFYFFGKISLSFELGWTGWE